MDDRPEGGLRTRTTLPSALSGLRYLRRWHKQERLARVDLSEAPTEMKTAP
jgi:hypothetical protein